MQHQIKNLKKEKKTKRKLASKKEIIIIKKQKKTKNLGRKMMLYLHLVGLSGSLEYFTWEINDQDLISND
uniref:Uncharacterized protein n=1 Tax=Rhizophora mucronata TaxID=61149 RepID=A0A2P2KHE5_RHIMU